MSIQVKPFDVYKAKEELKGCPKIVRDYVKLLEQHLDKQKQLTAKAVGKLVQQAKAAKEDGAI